MSVLLSKRAVNREGYTNLSYLQCQSGTWINSGVMPGQAEIEIAINAQYDGNLSSECWFATINKARPTPDAATFMQFGIWNQLFAIHLTGITVNGIERADTNYHNLVFSLNGSTATLTVDETYAVTNPYFQNGSFRNYLISFGGYPYRLYEATIKRNGELIRNFSPVTNNDTGENGLLDQMTSVFYPMN